MGLAEEQSPSFQMPPGLAGRPATVNPMIARQVAAQRQQPQRMKLPDLGFNDPLGVVSDVHAFWGAEPIAKASTVNPSMAAQVAKYRLTPRPEVTAPDLMKSQIISGLVHGVKAPYEAWQGNQLVDGVPLYSPQEWEQKQMQGAMDTAGLAMTGGFALGRVPANSLGMNVYHGTPHKVEKFDMGKIGTGEGNQAYGHGLYFAENPQVAKNYAPRDFGYEERLMKMYKQAEARRDYSAMEVLETAMLHQTPNELRTQFPKAGGLIDQIAAEQSKAKFNLYKVDLPDEHIAKMMDWDALMPKQPEHVRAAFDKALAGDPVYQAWKTNGAYDHISGGIMYRQLVDAMGPARGGTVGAQGSQQAAASESLKQMGIPGIRYLDQGSREGGKGTSNFVVFDDQLPKIIGRE